MRGYLERNQFESDGVADDLENAEDSNITNVVENDKLIETMIAFIRSVQCMFRHPCTAIVIFWY